MKELNGFLAMDERSENGVAGVDSDGVTVWFDAEMAEVENETTAEFICPVTITDNSRLAKLRNAQEIVKEINGVGDAYNVLLDNIDKGIKFREAKP